MVDRMYLVRKHPVEREEKEKDIFIGCLKLLYRIEDIKRLNNKCLERFANALKLYFLLIICEIICVDIF